MVVRRGSPCVCNVHRALARFSGAQTLLRAAQTMHAMKAYLPPLARLLMSSLFIWDGIVQLRDPSGTAKYLANVHVPIPDVAVWISIVFHLLTGLGILVGFKVRWE